MPSPTVILDACVLYPAPLRDLLMWLALSDLLRPRWTDAIHEEWIGNLLANRPDLTFERLNRTRELMNAAVPDCLVESYEDLIAELSLPDPKDRHVLAAAIRAEADLILTYNLTDFPVTNLQPYSVESQHPDEFVLRLLNEDADVVCAAVKKHRQSLKKPPKTVEDYLQTLTQQRLPQTVERLATFGDLI